MNAFLSSGPPFTVESLAEELAVSTRTVRRLLPKIGFARVAGCIRISRADVEAYLASTRVPPNAPAPMRMAPSGDLDKILDGAVQRVRRGSR